MNRTIRRDPRREWIARNRLHPEHTGSMDETAHPDCWMSPGGVLRRDPHAVGFIGANGLRRIDRSGTQQGARAGQGTAVSPEYQRRVVAIPSDAPVIAVVPDLPGGRLSSHDRDVLGLARQLAGDSHAVLAVVFGQPREAGFGDAGVDRLLHMDGEREQGYAPEARLTALAAVERHYQPRHWLLPDSRLGGGELGRRLATRLRERPATQVWQVVDGQCMQRTGSGQLDLRGPCPRILLAAEECADPVLDTNHAAEPVHLNQESVSAYARLEDHGLVAVDPAAIPLAEAEFVLSGGNGVQDWEQFHALARVLGATEGASRVAVDDGHMPRDRQVGASGTWVSARVYIAVGISGAVQHLQGIQTCDKVVAISNDPGCDMVKRADLSVIGDAGAILAALIQRADHYRRGAQSDAA